MSSDTVTRHQTSDVSWRALGLLTGSHVVNDLYQGAVPAIIPFLAASQHYSYLAVSGITLAATFISSVAQPAFGLLADRYRMRWTISAGTVVAAVGVALSGLLPSYALVWAAVALSGIGVAAYHPEASRLARRAAGTSAQGMSWFALGGNAGFALAPVTVTPLLAVTGLAGTPLLLVPAVVTAIVVQVFLPRLLAAPRLGSSPGQVSDQRDDVRSFLWLTGVVICRSILFFGLSSFLALHVIRTFHESTGVGAAALATFTVTGALATITGGWLADRAGRVRTVQLGYLVTIPGLAGLVLAPSVPVVFLAAIVCGVGVYLPFSVHTTLGQEYLPHRIGTASGVTLGLAVSAGGIASPALGALADAHGLVAALVALGAVPFVALVASTRLPETRRRPATG